MKKIVLILIILIVNCTLKIKDCPCQWLYQYAGYPGTPYDMKFFDANTGYISTDSSKIYKTTNGGNNWSFDRTLGIIQMQKLNDSTMFCMGLHIGQNYKIFKLFQKGQRWDSAAIPFDIGFATYTNMCFVNQDTGWICGFDGNYFHIWRTINGGISYQSQITGIGAGTIFFLNKKINGEYYGWCSNNSNLYKTTNSGVNWFLIDWFWGYSISIQQITMINENTGWVSTGDTSIWKTTNGGTNYFKQYMPNIPNKFSKSIQKITVLNSNLIYGIGGARWFGPGIVKGIIWKTTNGGLNWGFQQPDTSYPISRCYALDFIDSLTGWAAGYNGKIVHTTNGGGEIIYVGINNLSNEILEGFKLFQNYPNPFNSETKIKFEIPSSGFPITRPGGGNDNVVLKVFDMLGREVSTIVNESALGGQPGTYEVTFNGGNFPSGIYFVCLYSNNNFIMSRKIVLLR